MKLIAHKIRNVKEAKTALAAGADYIEVDVSKSFFFSRFTTQHDTIKGKLGIGHKITPLFSKDFAKKLFLDIKHAKLSRSYAQKLSLIFKSKNLKGFKISGNEWDIVHTLSKISNSSPYFTLGSIKDLLNIKNLIKKFKKPYKVSVRYTLIDKNFMKICKENRIEVWAWTVNDIKEAKRLKKLGVDGIITDEWQLLVRSEKLEM